MNDEPSPGDKAFRQLSEINRKSRDVRKMIRCESLIDKLQKWQKNLGHASDHLSGFRDKGYVHDGWLENMIEVLSNKIPTFLDYVHHASKLSMDEYGWHLDELARDLPDAEGRLGDNEAANNAVIAPLRDHVATLNRVAEDLLHRLREKKEPLEPYYYKIDSALRQISHTMERFHLSGIKLLPNEHPLRAADAEFKEASGAKGRIFLTDMRFRFTWIEKKVIKKGFLGIGRKTEELMTVMIDEEIGLIQEAVDTKMGFIIKDQILTLIWHGSAAFQTTTFEIEDNAREWDVVIEDVMSGRIDRDRIHV